MNFIFVGICMLIFFVTAMNVGPLNLDGWLKGAIMIPLLILVVYSLARIMPKELKSGK